MAGKPELSTTPGIQNVVVYISNDNFAQAYAVGQQNVGQGSHAGMHNGTYSNPPHSMASLVGPSKGFADKSQMLKLPEYSNDELVHGSVPSQTSYFSNNTHAVISHNGFPQQINNNLTNFQSLSVDNSVVLNQNNLIKSTVSYGGNNEVLPGESHGGPGRPDQKLTEVCDNGEGYVDSGFVTVISTEGPSQNVRCESVRSETAESSCSSLSSADESLIFVQQSSDMVVYDSGVSVRPGGVVLTVGRSGTAQNQNSAPIIGTASNTQFSVSVPFGWKRLLTNGIIIYIR